MSIEVTISQHVPAQFGERAYFSADCTATFSLDGNADNACMMAGSAVSGQIKSHMGDTLLIVVRVNGELRARWVGKATNIAAEAFDDFLGGGRIRDFAYTARHIAMREEAKRWADQTFYDLTASSRREFPCTEA